MEKWGQTPFFDSFAEESEPQRGLTPFFFRDPSESLMDWKILATVFATIFIAELGDKTQLATMLYAADKEVSKWTVFVGASLALIVASAIGVGAGGLVSQYLSERLLRAVAGLGFIVIRIWTLARS